MGFYDTRGSGKTVEGREGILREREAEVLLPALQNDYPQLFEKVEQNVEKPIDKEWLGRNKQRALKTAVIIAMETIDNLEHGKVTNYNDAVAIEASVQYRNFLENPGALAVYLASQVRG